VSIPPLAIFVPIVEVRFGSSAEAKRGRAEVGFRRLAEEEQAHSEVCSAPIPAVRRRLIEPPESTQSRQWVGPF